MRQQGAGGVVYPRVCGGTLVGALKRPPGSGLSPRVRGNPVAILVVLPYLGSIPACAGEPCSAIAR